MDKPNLTLISVLIASVLIICLLYNKNMKSQAREIKLTSIIKEKTDSIRHRKNKDGQTVSEKSAASVTPKQFEEAYADLAKELNRQFDVKIKDLRAVIKAEFEARGEGNAVTNYYNVYDSLQRDTVKAINFKVDDGYLDLDATILPSRSPYKYVYGDTLSYGFVAKKKWLLGREQLYGFGGLRNPNAKIIAATNVLIDSYRDKRWVVSAGVSYLPLTNQVQPSVTVGYALFKF